MGKTDVGLKAYLSDKRRFADLFNGTLMSGEQYIRAEELEQTSASAALSEERGSLERISDMVMWYQHKDSQLALIALENQEYVDFAMPVRVMLEQAMFYESQLKEKKKWNRQEGRLSDGDEYLSGIRKTDRILPVIVLVAYWGEEEWRGATSIHEMISFDAQTEKFRKYVPEYRVNVVNLKEYQDSEKFQTELKTFTGLYFCRNSRKKMQEYIESHEECREIDWETFWAIANISPKIRGLEKDYGKERIDMCKAMEEIWQEGVNKGKIEILRRMLAKEMPISEIADLMGQTEECILKEVKMIKENPSKTDGEIAEMMEK